MAGLLNALMGGQGWGGRWRNPQGSRGAEEQCVQGGGTILKGKQFGGPR